MGSAYYQWVEVPGLPGRRCKPVLGAGAGPRAYVPRLVEPCDACGEPIPKTAVEIEGPIIKGAVVKFHVRCFTLWQTERKAEANKG